MTKVSMSQDLDVPPEDAWKLIGGFNALPDWHPAVEKSELTDEGQTRTLKIAGGGEIVETLEKKSDAERTYSYRIVDAPLPVKNYTASITVKESGDGKRCTVEWSSEFDPTAPENEATEAVRQIYEAGLQNLRRMFGG